MTHSDMPCVRCGQLTPANNGYTYRTYSGNTDERMCYACLCLLVDAWKCEPVIEDRLVMWSAQREIAEEIGECLADG